MHAATAIHNVCMGLCSFTPGLILGTHVYLYFTPFMLIAILRQILAIVH